MKVHRVILAASMAMSLAGCIGHVAGVEDAEPSVEIANRDHSWGATVSEGAAVPEPATTEPAVAFAPSAPVVTVSETPTWGEQTVHPVSLPKGPQAVADADGPYLLDTGDRLRIFVYGQPNLSRLYTVDHHGNVVIPLIGKVRARGKTVYRLAATIRDRLGSQFVRDPQVTVDINQNRPFFIMGEIRNAGQFPFVSGMTVQKAIAIAGGYSERAKRGHARITRRINGVVEVLDVPSDYVVKPGDLIEIDERFF
jgi:polysaccharide export outer membrane protein